LRCEVIAGVFSIPVDEPEADGGTGNAATPTDLLLASLASCFTLALVHSAAKRAVPLVSLRVDVVGHYAGRRFDTVRVSVDADGPDAAQLAEMVTAADRLCYVTQTLRASVAVDVVAASHPAVGGS
jgi:uncharacterized OsmC-like protein